LARNGEGWAGDARLGQRPRRRPARSAPVTLSARQRL